MQIILSKEECEIIYEALITEIEEQQDQNNMDERRGRSTAYGETRLDKIRILKMRIEPYVEN